MPKKAVRISAVRRDAIVTQSDAVALPMTCQAEWENALAGRSHFTSLAGCGRVYEHLSWPASGRGVRHAAASRLCAPGEDFVCQLSLRGCASSSLQQTSALSPTRALWTAANAASIHEERRKAAQRRDYAFDAYQFDRGSQQRMAQGMLPFCGSGLFAKGT